MRKRCVVALTTSIFCTAVLLGASRPADIAFRVQMIDPGYNETAAVADLNKDGKLDIISGKAGTKRPSGPSIPCGRSTSAMATLIISAILQWMLMAMVGPTLCSAAISHTTSFG